MNKILTLALMSGTVLWMQSAQAMVPEFVNQVQLTDEQRAKAEQIFEKGDKKVEQLKQEEKEIREKIEKVRQDTMDELKEILTPEQIVDLRNAERDSVRRPRMRGMHEVTPEQKQKMMKERKKINRADRKNRPDRKDRPNRKEKPQGGFVEE